MREDEHEFLLAMIDRLDRQCKYLEGESDRINNTFHCIPFSKLSIAVIGVCFSVMIAYLHQIIGFDG